MARLNQSFGIGIIKLNATPYQSKILFPAAYRDLDFKTIDKQCKMNSEFNKLFEQTEKLLTLTDERYYKSIENEPDEFCDDYFANDAEVENYSKVKHILTGDEDNE